jgi:hypothetical protein
VKAEDAELERLLDEGDGLLDEVLLVGHEGEDHADGQLVREHQPRREIDRETVSRPKIRSLMELKAILARPRRTLAFTTSA